MEREQAVLMHREVVQPFIKDAFKEGAHRIKPKYVKKNQWFRQIMIGVVYNDIGSTATLEELAGEHGAFRQSIADSNKFFLRNLYNSSSPELQERHSLNEILTARKPRKPLSRRSKEKFSLAQGGTSFKIKEQVESGVTDRGKISENTGIPKRSIIVAACTTLKDWGVNVPRKLASHREVLAQLDKETDDKKIQELLDGLPYFVIHNRRRERSFLQFSSLSPLIREAGFRSRDNHPFATSLKAAGVPISRKDRFLKDGTSLTYYTVLSRHKDKIIHALREDQSLQRFQRESNG